MLLVVDMVRGEGGLFCIPLPLAGGEVLLCEEEDCALEGAVVDVMVVVPCGDVEQPCDGDVVVIPVVVLRRDEDRGLDGTDED